MWSESIRRRRLVSRIVEIGNFTDIQVDRMRLAAMPTANPQAMLMMSLGWLCR